MELKEIKLADIVIGKTNPRKTFDEQIIEELAQSIIEKGVLQPIVVRVNGKPGKYELVCGERRVRASLKAQTAKKTITTIPAVIRQLTNEEALEVQIIENLQRKDVHPMEEAVAFKGLIDLKKFAESQEALGVEELRGAVLFLFETNYNAKGTCEKLLKSQGSYSNADLAIYKKLEAMKHSQLSQVFHAMLRTSILAKLSPTKGGANQRPDANGHAAAFNSIAKLYMPKEIEEIEMNQLNERANREVRVDARIKSLTKKISELKSAKK